MANLSITRAWNETSDFVRREAGLLFPISFLLIALPRALIQAVTPEPILPGQSPPAGLWLLLVPVLVVAAIVGNVAISYLALKPGRSVGEALRRGVGRLGAMIGAAILIGLAAMVLLILVAVVVFLLVPGALGAAESGVQNPAALTALALTIIAILPFAFYFGARLMMITPAAAAEEAGPVALIGRSWTLTRPYAWKLVGFLLLVALLIVVVTGAIAAVSGILFALVAGPIRPGSTSAWLVIIVMSLVNMVVTAYLTSLVARVYAQIAGTSAPEVFA